MTAKVDSQVEIERLVDCAIVHKADNLRSFLEDVGLAKSGTKDVLKDRLREYLESDSKNAVVLTDYLNILEGWGNQHVYIYNAPSGLSKQWRNRAYVEQVSKKNGVSKILNSSRPVILPQLPTLASIVSTSQRVRFYLE